MMRAFARSHQRPDPENKSAASARRHGTHILGLRRKVSTCRQRALSTVFSGIHEADTVIPHADNIAANCTRATEHVDEGGELCAGVTPYCSVLAVGYDISCGSIHPPSLIVWRRRSSAVNATGEGQGILFMGIFEVGIAASPPGSGDAARREEYDDGIDLVRRSRQAVEETLGVRTFGEPDRGGTRKCDTERSDRQSSPARPVGPGQEPDLRRSASAQGTSRAADDARHASGLARQHRARPGLRSRGRARSDHLRQRGADEPAAVAAGVERGHLSLAGRRSVEPGFLLLRWQGAGQPALLRPSLAHRLSACGRSPTAGPEGDAVRLSATGLRGTGGAARPPRGAITAANGPRLPRSLAGENRR